MHRLKKPSSSAAGQCSGLVSEEALQPSQGSGVLHNLLEPGCVSCHASVIGAEPRADALRWDGREKKKEDPRDERGKEKG